jgi:hypothetical protein
MPPEIYINTDLPKRRKKPVKPPAPAKEHRDIFSEDTARFLLRVIKGKKQLPGILPGLRQEYLKKYNPEKHSGQQISVQEELAAAIREKLAPWIWSCCLHCCLLILLLFLFMPAKNRISPFDIILDLGNEEIASLGNGGGNDTFGNGENGLITVITPQNLPQVEQPKQELLKEEPVETATDIIPQSSDGQTVVLVLNGRDPGSRENQLGGNNSGFGNGTGSGIGDGNGGTGKTDAAVLAALRWLVKNQLNDGSWSLCGPYRDAAVRTRENKIAATAMALLAFQGYGVVPSSPHPQLIEFSGAVSRGWDYLL